MSRQEQNTRQWRGRIFSIVTAIALMVATHGLGQTRAIKNEMESNGYAASYTWCIIRGTNDIFQIETRFYFDADVSFEAEKLRAYLENGNLPMVLFYKEKIDKISNQKKNFISTLQNERRYNIGMNFTRKDIDALEKTLAKYDEWVSVSKKERLASQIRREMPMWGQYAIAFITPDLLEVGNWILKSDDVSKIKRLVAMIPEMDTEAKTIESRALERAASAEKKQREESEKRKTDEDKVKAVLH